MIDVSNLIFLGSFADLDPTEGNTLSENTSALVGQTFTHTGMQILPVSLDHTGDGNITDNGENGATREYVSYNTGSGTITTEVDGTITVFATVTTSNKATQTIQITVVQMLNGDLFFADCFNNGTLDNLQISSIRVDSISSTSLTSFVTNQNITNSAIVPIDTTVNGTAGNDTIPINFVDAQGDSIDGGDGLADRVDAGAGNDNVNSGLGNDTVYAGTGDDFVFAESGDDSVFGGDGNDQILGGAGNDTLYGEAGNDSINGNANNDLIYGGDGADSILGNQGDDKIYAGAGNDTTYADDATGSASLTFEQRIADQDGTGGNDRMFGSLGADQIWGEGGSDSIVIGSAADGAGDTIVGGNGPDQTSDNDVLDLRGAGVVTITAASDTSDAGAQSGTVTFSDGSTLQFYQIETILRDGDGVVDGTAGNDTLSVGYTDVQGDVIDGADGLNDRISAGAGNDVVSSGQGDDTIYGGLGIDTVWADVGNDLIYGGEAGDALQGADGADTLYGDAGNDMLDGGAGNDSLFGGDGSDTLVGGGGADTLDGGAGDDDIVVSGAESALGAAGDDHFTLDITQIGISDSVTIVGGETGEDLTDPTNGGAGDILDLTNSLGPVEINFGAGSESGTVNGIDSDAGVDITFSEIEKLIATDSDDSVFGGAATGPMNIESRAGNDLVHVGAGNDIVLAGAGDDIISGNAGTDSLLGEDGNDSVYGGFGNDTLYGGAGDDFIVGDEPHENGDDLIYGGAGNDVLIGNVGADSLYGGDGNDFFYGGFNGQAGADVLDGGQGVDTASYEYSNAGVNVNLATGLGSGGDAAGDSFSSIEVVLGSDFADSLTGGAGNDTLLGGLGSDTIAGGEGADYLDAGAGDDDIVVGAGDVAYGGAGDDVFTINTALTGNANVTVAGGETGEDATDPSNGGAGDILDLRGGSNVQVVYDQLDPTWNGLTSESGTATYRNAAGQDVTIQFSAIEQVIVCFAAGTMIDTAEGEKPIEALQVGDLVRTADHDYQPIRWIGSSKVEAKGNLAPILIKAGALGNTRDLKVSPQHRMLLGGWQAEMLFGDDEVLVAAKHLANDSTILRAEGGEVEYFHMLFDTHEIVFAEGAPSESFHPGEVGWGALAEEARAEILALFPELAWGDFSAYGTSARRTLKAGEARVMQGLA